MLQPIICTPRYHQPGPTPFAAKRVRSGVDLLQYLQKQERLCRPAFLASREVFVLARSTLPVLLLAGAGMERHLELLAMASNASRYSRARHFHFQNSSVR